MDIINFSGFPCHQTNLNNRLNSFCSKGILSWSYHVLKYDTLHENTIDRTMTYQNLELENSIG